MLNNKSGREEYIDVELSINNLDDLIFFIISENSLVTRKARMKVYNLINRIDIDNYKDDRSMEVRVYFITKYLEGMFEKGIENHYRLIEYSKGFGQFEEEISDIVAEIHQYQDLNDEEVLFIDEYVSNILNYDFIYRHQSNLDKLSVSLKTQNYDNLSDFCDLYNDEIEKLYQEFNKNKKIHENSSLDFSSNESDSLLSAITHTHNLITRPNHKIKSSVQYFNRMISGGFESGRFYLFLGFPGGWKSGMLLNICLDAKKYNKDFVTKDPTKEPCVLYITQENSIAETIERIWSHYKGDTSEMKDLSINEIMEELDKEGFNEGIHLEIKHRTSRSINTSDVDNMIDDLRVEGKEVVMLVHDYMKRINSTEKTDGTYEELGAVSDEFCSIAKNRSIPVISASQLNREAARVLEAANSSNSSDILQKIGTSHTGESMKMIDNSDVVIAINREFTKINKDEEKQFLSYKRLKFRGRLKEEAANMVYFAHPFENGMKLVPDIHKSKSDSVRDLASSFEGFNAGEKRNQRREISEFNGKGIRGGKKKAVSKKPESTIIAGDVMNTDDNDSIIGGLVVNED